MVQDEAEDAGLLAQVKDDNDVMRQPQHRTCLDICLDCYNYQHFWQAVYPASLACSNVTFMGFFMPEQVEVL